MVTGLASLSAGAGVASAGGGGVDPPAPPQLTDVVCMRTCGGLHEATAGSTVKATGENLSGVTKFLFPQQGGGWVAGEIVRVRSSSVTARVPDGAVTGEPRVKDDLGNRSRSPKTLRIVSPSEIPSDSGFALKSAKARPGKSFYDGTHAAKITYYFAASGPTDVRIQVVHVSNGKIVDTFVDRGAEPYTANTARWRGGPGDPNGEYRFRIGSTTSGKMDSDSEAHFRYYKWEFPVRGRHTYGDGYGAARAGHVHMGQDVLAPCGTPLVAARGGRVQYRGYQAGGAGYYVVIDGKRDHHDYVYMHLRQRASVRPGEHVQTGERIGTVGRTGDATACHLHFEYWSNDWWNGGRALRSVTKVLERWDGWS